MMSRALDHKSFSCALLLCAGIVFMTAFGQSHAQSQRAIDGERIIDRPLREFHGIRGARHNANHGPTATLNDVIVYAFSLEGAQEVPPNDSPATGECLVTLDTTFRTLDVQCSYEGLLGNCTGAHVHDGAPGANGPVMVGLTHTGGTSGTASSFGFVQPLQMQTILDGNAYVNVHSTVFPGGEIRGQIVEKTPPEPQSLHFGGLLHTALENALLKDHDSDGDGIPDLLVISNIGSSGNDGVRIVHSQVPQGTHHGVRIVGWSGEIDLGEAGELPEDLSVATTAFTFDTQIFAAYSGGIAGGGGGSGHGALHLSRGVCFPCTFSVEAFHHGELVGSAVMQDDVAATGPFGSVNGKGMEVELLSRLLEEEGIFSYSVRLPQPQSLTLASGGNPVLADELVVTMSGIAPADPTLLHIDVTATNTESIAILNERLSLRSYVDGIDLQGTFYTYSLRGAQMMGTCLFHVPDECTGAFKISNIGSTGDDGVTFGDAKDVGGLPTESDALAGNVQPGRKIQLDPVILDLSGDGISELKIESEWCGSSASDPNDACGDSIVYYSSRLEATGGPNGEASVHVDFSQLDTNEMVVSIHDSTGNLQVAPAIAISVGVSTTISAVPASSSVQIESVTDAAHAHGEHTPALIWRFAQPVSINIDTVGAFTGDELRLSPGNGNGDGEFMIVKKSKNHLLISGGSGGGGSGGAIHITGIEPAAVSFSQGTVFGFEHTATDGAELTIGCGSKCKLPPGAGKNLPLVISSTSCDSSVSIDLGDAAEGFGFTRVGNSAPTSLKLFSVTGQPSPVGEALFGPCPPPPDNDPLCDGLPSGLDDPGYFAFDLSELGVEEYLIEFILDGEVVHSVVHSSSLAGPGLGGPVIYHSNFTEPTEISTAFGGHDVQHIRAHVGNPAQEASEAMVARAFAYGQHVAFAHSVDISALGHELTHVVQQQPGFIMNPPLSDPANPRNVASGESETCGEWLTIVDEWVGLFDLEHRASGTARLRTHMMGDPDVSITRSLGLSNPSKGYPATLSSLDGKGNDVLTEEVVVAIGIPDPCAGLPPECIGWPDGATLQSTVHLSTGTHGTKATTLAVGLATDNSSSLLTTDFASLGAATFTVEVLNGDTVVATIGEFADGTSMATPGVAAATSLYWSSADADEQGGIVHVTLGWDEPQTFTFSANAAGDETYEGDALRFTAETDLELLGIHSHSLTTIDIPELHILAMSIEEVPQPESCSGDLNADGLVNGFDLVDLLSCWGPTSPQCEAADINDDGLVNGFDLVDLLSSWGPCP